MRRLRKKRYQYTADEILRRVILKVWKKKIVPVTEPWPVATKKHVAVDAPEEKKRRKSIFRYNTP